MKWSLKKKEKKNPAYSLHNDFCSPSFFYNMTPYIWYFSEEGVMDLLDIEDMVRMKSPDPKSIITYLNDVYRVFVIECEWWDEMNLLIL